MKPFFVVLARDSNHVREKIDELERLKAPYLIVCGEKLDLPNVLHRPPKGKCDAINFGVSRVPKDAKIIALNDVDTKIHNAEAAFRDFERTGASLLFAKIKVGRGPQIFLNTLLDSLKRRIIVTASGDLLLIRRDVLNKLLPLKPCKADDSYILFKVLENGYKAVFCEECFTATEKTDSYGEEENYKRRTVTGIYQALSYSKPPVLIRLFYALLPFASPLLLILGRKGYYFARGVLLGFLDFTRGDRGGYWLHVDEKPA